MTSRSRIKLGMSLPIGVGALGDGKPVPWTALREMAKTAEEIGFDALMAPDHLLFRRSPPGNVPAVDMPEGKSRGIWEVWTVLSAAAEATRRVHLGTLVACTGFRNPALLAKMAETLDEISGGRVMLGLGAGWHEPEYDAFGYPFDHRVSRFEEALQIIVPLLRHGRVDFQGQYYQARACEILPRGPRPNGLPIFMGAQGPRMLRLIARHADSFDADYQTGPTPVLERLALLEQACREVGRDPRSIGRMAATRIALAGPSGASGFQVGPAQDGIAQFDLAGMRFPARLGSADEVAAHIRAFEAIGIEHLTVNIVDPPGVPGIERFAAVMEALRR
ncbi:MAG TPA: LLM class flavin-dependent oxidoreductase [Methylomirabilota bacterium]|jgi:probable F420-dependent oxidoreductase|nr:LLM class flavin-dependent oxidoreductase [Methylomirabilota bacterium]